jgi:hypothetical protein
VFSWGQGRNVLALSFLWGLTGNAGSVSKKSMFAAPASQTSYFCTMQDNYLDALQQGDEAGLHDMYEAYCQTLTFREQVVDADPAQVFQASALHLARLDRQGLLPAGMQPEAMFDTLATAYRASWQDDGEPEAMEPLWPDEADMDPDWLGAAELAQTRQHISAWQTALIADPAFVPDDPDEQVDFNLWQQLRQITDVPASVEPAELPLPELPEPPVRPETSRFWPRAFAGFLLLTAGYIVYYFAAGRTNTADVFKDNFATPSGLLADLDKRYPAGDTSGARANCGELLRQADEFYQKEHYEAALRVLEAIVFDTVAARCHADAHFYLGVICLKLEKPGDALQNLAKIDNLEAYGEDLYWYQALAFVQLAQYRPDMRPVALRAVERARSNTTNAERRAQTEEMLQKLAD